VVNFIVKGVKNYYKTFVSLDMWATRKNFLLHIVLPLLLTFGFWVLPAGTKEPIWIMITCLLGIQGAVFSALGILILLLNLYTFGFEITLEIITEEDIDSKDAITIAIDTLTVEINNHLLYTSIVVLCLLLNGIVMRYGDGIPLATLLTVFLYFHFTFLGGLLFYKVNRVRGLVRTLLEL
jgi:hypothetical protein